jgi:hypothetical protein
LFALCPFPFSSLCLNLPPFRHCGPSWPSLATSALRSLDGFAQPTWLPGTRAQHYSRGLFANRQHCHRQRRTHLRTRAHLVDRDQATCLP